MEREENDGEREENDGEREEYDGEREENDEGRGEEIRMYERSAGRRDDKAG